MKKTVFSAPDEYWSHRAKLISKECPWQICTPRLRAMAHVIKSIYSTERLRTISIHEAAPMSVGLSAWLAENCNEYIGSGYFPEMPFGSHIGKLRNENLEAQTFPDKSFELVIHGDVLEHLYDPFQALTEIRRTLFDNGVCIFTAPTYPDRLKSEQVAFPDGRIIGKPEYHGNPQGDGSLVTWRFGYDLPELINQRSGFDVEVRRWYSQNLAITGPMTEVYILRKIAQ